MTGLIKLVRTILGGLLLLVFAIAAVIISRGPSSVPSTAAPAAPAAVAPIPQAVQQTSLIPADPPAAPAAPVPHLDWLRQVHARHVEELQAQAEALRLGRKAQRDLARKELARYASGAEIHVPELPEIVIGRQGRLASFHYEALNVLAPDEALVIRGPQVYLLRGVNTARMVSGQNYQLADVDVRIEGPFAYKSLLGVEQRVPIITLIELTPAISALRQELSTVPPAVR